MRRIPIRMTVDGDGQLRVQVPITLPPGDYEAVLMLTEPGKAGDEVGLARAQAIVRRYVSSDRSLSAELIQERREAAARE